MLLYEIILTFALCPRIYNLMRYISTSDQSITDLRGAIMHCMAPDGSLYLPEMLPVIPKAYFNNIQEMSLQEIAFVVVSTLLGSDVDTNALKHIVDMSFNFPMPVYPLANNLDILELFHGPTMAFKDAGARFLAYFVSQFHKSNSRRPMGLVATTGNTGAAIANAFMRHKDKHVAILFPRGAMSRAQLAQIAIKSPNIHVIEVSGNISQCKEIIRTAMSDQSLAERMMPVCVNTNNFLRIVPQVVFFFHAYAMLKNIHGHADGFTVSIPCGCLSNLTAAVIAKRIGCPIGKIVAGCNANDDFVRVLEGELPPEKVHINNRPTLARAMDSGAPTNLRRILHLYNNDIEAIREDITGISLSDDDIADTINGTFARRGYLTDPHTAVALGALSRSGIDYSYAPAVVLATAHPAKSLDTMTAITGRSVELPLQLTRFMTDPHSRQMPVKIPPTYPALKKYLFSI